MKSIVWLASFPKSGNTWLRAFLANYVRNSDKPCPINKIHHLGIGDSNAKLYNRVAKGPFDINDPVQTAQMRKDVLQAIVNNKADVNFVKTHCENGVAYGVKLIPTELSRSAIYIARNPLDIVSSYANHYGISIDDTIYSMSQKNAALVGDGENACQFLGSWSNHVIGWSKARKFPVLMLRYEDMKNDPHTAFERVVQHIGLPQDQDRLDRAIQFSDFKELQEQEKETSFVEKSHNNQAFFRRGKSGQWKKELSDEQIAKVLQVNGRVMKKFGYEI